MKIITILISSLIFVSIAQAKSRTTYDICRNHQTTITSDNDKFIQTEVSDSSVYETVMNNHSLILVPLAPKSKGESVAVKIQLKSGKEVILLETDCDSDKIVLLDTLIISR